MSRLDMRELTDEDGGRLKVMVEIECEDGTTFGAFYMDWPAMESGHSHGSLGGGRVPLLEDEAQMIWAYGYVETGGFMPAASVEDADLKLIANARLALIGRARVVSASGFERSAGNSPVRGLMGEDLLERVQPGGGPLESPR